MVSSYISDVKQNEVMTNTSYVQSEDLRFQYKSPDNYKPVRSCSVQFLVILVAWPLWNICVTNDHGYVPPVVNTSRSFPHS